MQPKISVIIPVYKAEKYLHRCVDSILAQTFTDFELILVNDGSPDNSGAICDEYAQKDNRIKVIHKKNGGASDTRNVGLDHARGEIICFVDSDDWVDNKFLEIFVEKDADVVVQGYYKTINDSESCFEEYYIPIEACSCNDVGTFLKTIHEADNLGYLPMKTLKREIIEKLNLRLNTTYKFREDLEFFLRYLTECKSFITINKGTYHYVWPTDPNKYDFVNPESNFRCTVSIIENFNKLARMPDDLYISNINSLSSSVIAMYKNTEFNIDEIIPYVKTFCNYCKKCNDKKSLSKKSTLLYFIIGKYTPKFLHRLYRIIISKLY